MIVHHLFVDVFHFLGRLLPDEGADFAAAFVTKGLRQRLAAQHGENLVGDVLRVPEVGL